MSTSQTTRRTFLKGAATIGAAAGMGTVLYGSAALAQEQAAALGKHTWEVVPEPIDPASIAHTVDCDVLVVGAGIAGMSAFMYAAEAGANTVIIEKLGNYHGRGLDLSAIGTKLQKELGIEVDKGQIMNDLVKASGYKADGALIKLWADHSGWVVDRLIDIAASIGLTTTAGAGAVASADATDFMNRTYPTDHNFGMLHAAIQNIIGAMEQTGIAAGGQSLYNMKGEQLLKDETGRVTGLVALGEDGTYTQFNVAKGIILATGDYGHNDEMMAAWCPLVLNADGSTYPEVEANTGDGILMAMWAGGAIQPGAHAAMVHPIAGGGAFSTASYLKVNNSGKRFCNENTTLPGISNMYMCSANREVWAIFDNDYQNQVPNMSALSTYNNNTSGPLTKLFMEGLADPANPPSLAEQVDICLEMGTTVKADTLEELAGLIGVPTQNLAETVARYNQLVELGVDEDFQKEPENLFPIVQPPFYASKLTARLLAIASGLNVNSQMQVLDTADTAIEGLYAVGNVMGNFFANDYPICCPGLSHGRCVTLGALIGKAVATDVPVQSISAE